MHHAGLQVPDDLVIVLELLLSQSPDLNSPARKQANEPLALQLDDGFLEGGLADAELPAHPVDVDRSARLDPPLLDLVPQIRVELLAQRSGLDHGAGFSMWWRR